VTIETLPDDAGVRVLLGTGELDILSVTPLLPQLEGWVAGAGGVVLDLAEVSFFDSFGVHLVDALARHCHAQGAGFRVVAPPGMMVRRVLEIVGLAGLALPDRASATAAVTPA
jgi:anti-anti-sigma factor